ncbi:MAG: CapA family protein [Bacteroidales bacterium]
MKDINIAFVGDIMPGGLLHYSNSSFINGDVLNYLNTFDLRVGTLECALGDDLEYYRNLMDEKARNKNTIYAKNDDIQKIKKLNIDIVTIANNHICDLGEEGLLNTINILEKNNIKFCGAGKNIHDASKPAIINLNNKSCAFIGCTDDFKSTLYPSPYAASEKNPGFNPLNINTLSKDISKAKKLYDYVFVLPHWGNEYTYFPPYRCKQFAYEMINAGADGVFGGHSHTIQPIIFYKKRPIVFSMGNFLFPDRFVQPPAPTYYPENLDRYKNAPKSNSPRCSTITLKTWKPMARVGMIVNLTISDRITIGKQTTKLNSSNQIIFFKIKKRIKYLLLVNSVMIKCCYKQYLFFIAILTKVKRKLKTLL